MPLTLSRFIAGGFGTGAVPVAAGTVASVAATLAGGALLAASPIWLALAAFLAITGGYWAIRHARVEGDPGWVTIDEFAGQFITLLGLAHPSPAGLLIGFVLFRILDITKLGPVGWADRQHGAFGIMADDVIAGAIGAILLFGLRLAAPAVLA
jgi:phosphatidylglycerophosphatase A